MISTVATRRPRGVVARRIPPTRWLARGMSRGLILPALLLGGPASFAVVLAANRHRLFYDFRGGLYDGGVAILHGRSPYRVAFIAHQAAVLHHGGVAIGETAAHPFSVPLYPAFANLAVVPLSALPFAAAAAIYSIVSVAAMFGALTLLGVRDRRCHAMVLISWPFLYGMFLGAIGPLLALGAAAAWRWRRRTLIPAAALATIIAAKLFPWPLAVWLLITRRWRAFAATLALGAALTFGAWALIGFHGLASYPRMLADATAVQDGRADSVTTVLLVLGVSSRLAQAAALLTGLATLGLAARLARRPDGGARAFGLAIIACLLATPIVWDHYMVLLFVPIALLSPRFSRLWALPVITPTLITLSYAAFPLATRAAPHPASSLNSAFGWLLAEAILVLALASTPQQRAAWIVELRGLARRPRALGAVA
jgi:hypothetical protein